MIHNLPLTPVVGDQAPKKSYVIRFSSVRYLAAVSISILLILEGPHGSAAVRPASERSKKLWLDYEES